MKLVLIILPQLLLAICNVSGNLLLGKVVHRMQNMLVYSIHVSQSLVVTCFGCGGKFNNSFVAYCLQNISTKNLKIF